MNYVFIANDYIRYFSSNHLMIPYNKTDCCVFLKGALKNLIL